jgi:pimeloyl-ACP methyl ester carboxylesterase
MGVAAAVDIEPFRIDITDDDLDDLRARLTRTRRPDALADAAWSDGIVPRRLDELVRRWRDDFDWRAVERRLNAFPQITSTIDGVPLHAIHAPAERSSGLAVVLLHGWPSTVAEFVEVIEPLRSGAPGLDVIVPSLPGYGFSGPLIDRGWDQDRMADAIDQLMRRLGYDRYIAHGGDVGYEVATSLGRRHPDRVAGLHLNLGGIRLAGEHRGEQPRDDAEAEAFARLERYLANGSAYANVQATRPQTLAYALTDSPVGQLAWIAEKFHEWADPRHPVSDDDILTAASVYWFTRTAGSSARFYQEAYGRWSKEAAPIPVPTSIQSFPYEIVRPVRRWAEERFAITRWVDMPEGGHFSALETPALVIDSLRDFARSLGTEEGRLP